MTDYYDRDGNPMPDDWWDKKKHGHMARYWSNSRRVARTIIGDITVSTSWLGLDHDFLTGTPVIFETMTFGDPWNYELTRYSTEEAAMRGHLDVLDRLRAGRPPFAHLDNRDDEMTPNAFLCAHCGHHENLHIGRLCEGSAYCTCTGFTPGNYEVCAGFGCTTCHDTITSLVDWQLHESPAAQSEQRRRENAARWNWREA